MFAHQINILKDVVNLPTAPFAEQHVIAYIRRFIASRPGLALQRDRFGNLLVTYKGRGLRRDERPLLFAAHMDHPGFVARRMLDSRRVLADWRGWVQSPYFERERIQFYSGGRWHPALIERVIPRSAAAARRASAASARSFGAEGPPARVVARVSEDVLPGSPGMWRLGDAVIRGAKLRARACDDLAGLAAVLCMLDEMCRGGRAPSCMAFFTRAEEVGFAGALAAVAARSVPRRAVVVAVECSKAVTGVALGDGPVLRVGDKASVFTPGATAYCQAAAEELAKRGRRFRYQRKLMDGGTCESTAYCHYGYDATGICLPLGNYHNMDTERLRIGPEFIDTRDYLGLVSWFVALARGSGRRRYDGTHPGLAKRLNSLLKEHRPRLLATARLAD